MLSAVSAILQQESVVFGIEPQKQQKQAGQACCVKPLNRGELNFIQAYHRFVHRLIISVFCDLAGLSRNETNRLTESLNPVGLRENGHYKKSVFALIINVDFRKFIKQLSLLVEMGVEKSKKRK